MKHPELISHPGTPDPSAEIIVILPGLPDRAGGGGRSRVRHDAKGLARPAATGWGKGGRDR